jgi:hypothetical protein
MHISVYRRNSIFNELLRLYHSHNDFDMKIGIGDEETMRIETESQKHGIASGQNGFGIYLCLFYSTPILLPTLHPL